MEMRLGAGRLVVVVGVVEHDRLAAEHEEAVRRLASAVPVVAPHAESRHAYVRRAGGMTFVCPWETRLRSWLAFARLQGEGMPAGLIVPGVLAIMPDVLAGLQTPRSACGGVYGAYCSPPWWL